MEVINFTKCTLAFMEERARLTPQSTSESTVLKAWVGINTPLTELEEHVVRMFSEHLDMNAFHWREYDLSMHFIGPILSLVNFTVRGKFNLFAQENFEAVINDDITLSGRADEVIATGFRAAKLPLFAVNEYKKETDPDGDPNGQCLAAMLVAQKLNNNDLPIYGCVIIGRVWRFVVLEGSNYTFSKNFDGAVFEDACQIVRILKELKAYCILRTA